MASSVRIRPPALPSDAEILGRAGGENFTVASRLLPAASRRHLMAFYGYARLVDQLGDDYAGDRRAALDWVDAELDAALADPTTPDLHRLVAAAAASILDLGADAAPLRDLIAANRMDQDVSSYRTWDDLVGYCRLSANPVGRLVLAAFGATTPERLALSDDVCTALQVAEHLQDVAEDALAGRVYLPAVDLARFGVTEGELADLARTPALDRTRSRTPDGDRTGSRTPDGDGTGNATSTAGRATVGSTPASVRALVAFEAARARALLDRGAPLVGTLRGRSRAATAGFVAGGYGALDAVADNGFDPFHGTTRPSARRVAVHFVALMRRGGVA